MSPCIPDHFVSELAHQMVQWVGVDVRQKRADHRALWRTLRRRNLKAVLKHTRLQPFPDQTDNTLVADPVLNELDQPIMIDCVEERTDIGIENPMHLSSCDSVRERIQRIVLTAPGPEPIAKAQKLRLVDRRQDQDQRGLDDFVLQGCDAERP